MVLHRSYSRYCTDAISFAVEADPVKSLFPQHFPLTQAQLDEIWDEGIIVFDTNVLLRMFRFRSQTVDEIMAYLNKNNERVWIPYQVAWEYHNNRFGKIRESEKSYAEIVNILKNACKSISKNLDEVKGYGINPVVELEGMFQSTFRFIESKVAEIEKTHAENSPNEHYAKVHDQIGTLYEGRVGPAPSDEDLVAMCAIGKERYDTGTPPGFKDVPEKLKAQRADREVYGDYILWKQAIDYLSGISKPLLFVTEDAKDDWWFVNNGKTIGPLPDLIAEYMKFVGRPVQFYRVDSFLVEANRRSTDSVSSAAIDDVKRVSSALLEEAAKHNARRSTYTKSIDGYTPYKTITQSSIVPRKIITLSVPEDMRSTWVKSDIGDKRSVSSWGSLNSRLMKTFNKFEIERLSMQLEEARRKYESALSIYSDFNVLYEQEKERTYFDGNNVDGASFLSGLQSQLEKFKSDLATAQTEFTTATMAYQASIGDEGVD